MSRTLLIAPHADDETLFAAYLAQRYAATIAVVYDEDREQELSAATSWLGCAYFQLHAQKGQPEEIVETYMNGLRDQAGQDDWDRVILPGFHPEGHEEHNLVNAVGEIVFKDMPRLYYASYGPRGTRIRTTGGEVFPDRPEYVARKLAALSCYRSQISNPDTAPWFYGLLDMREWIA